MRNKGQTFTPDFLGSMLVFGIILTIFLSTWNTVLDDQSGMNQERNDQVRATHTTAFLVTTPGYPENWEDDLENVQIPGFANPSNILQEDKIDAFKSIDYQDQRRLLQAPEFHITINTTGEDQNHTIGEIPEPEDYAIPIDRKVEVNTSQGIRSGDLRLVIWN